MSGSLNRPFVRLKIAASLDGRTALNNGVSQWITGPEARADGHAWRAQADAILTGAGTVLADNPLLNVRGVAVNQQPALVIVDSRLETPPSARLFGENRAVFIYAAQPDAVKQAALEQAGATIIYQPGPVNAKGAKVDLFAMMQDLWQKGIRTIHAEAGTALNASLLRGNLVDELLVYLAPKLIGAGLPMAALPELISLENAIALDWHDVQRIGQDLRLRATLRLER
jgi:diaminohydroxyphosphoribosylaminopyrimidine deaminase/5-amino-6-(5-phosphoribosylamino)uracil reductase